MNLREHVIHSECTSVLSVGRVGAGSLDTFFGTSHHLERRCEREALHELVGLLIARKRSTRVR